MNNNQDLIEMRDFLWLETELFEDGGFEDQLMILNSDINSETAIVNMAIKLKELCNIYNPFVVKMLSMKEDYENLSNKELEKKYKSEDHKEFCAWIDIDNERKEKDTITKIKDFFSQ